MIQSGSGISIADASYLPRGQCDTLRFRFQKHARYGVNHARNRMAGVDFAQDFRRTHAERRRALLRPD